MGPLAFGSAGRESILLSRENELHQLAGLKKQPALDASNICKEGMQITTNEGKKMILSKSRNEKIKLCLESMQITANQGTKRYCQKKRNEMNDKIKFQKIYV